MKIEIGQIISQIFSFLIMYWILNRYGWQPLLKVLHERKERIKAELNNIEDEKQRLSELRNDYVEKINHVDRLARSKFHQATEQGRERAFAIEQEALQEAKKILQKAQDDSRNEVLKAKKQLRDEIVNLTMEATKKIISFHLDEEKQKQLILDFVKEAEL
ncbi:ATP synthase subunit b [Chlamydiales bacterium STE3]|nr:ATP synthase subunit b [Chlamydiales bacterium STE3]